MIFDLEGPALNRKRAWKEGTTFIKSNLEYDGTDEQDEALVRGGIEDESGTGMFQGLCLSQPEYPPFFHRESHIGMKVSLPSCILCLKEIKLKPDGTRMPIL